MVLENREIIINNNNKKMLDVLLTVGLKKWTASAFFFFFNFILRKNGRTSAQIKYCKGCLRLFTLR